jgi:hypothetical protein
VSRSSTTSRCAAGPDLPSHGRIDVSAQDMVHELLARFCAQWQRPPERLLCARSSLLGSLPLTATVASTATEPCVLCRPALHLC